MIIAQIPELYKPIIDNKHLFYIYYGGRGAGKTENVAQILVLLALQEKYRILCIRESQNSINESVKATLEKWIDTLHLNYFFEITKNNIVSDCGSEFLFLGMREHTAINVKSIANINITWVEEAEAFSKRSWELLVPSVIRTPNPRIIVTFNPRNKDDAIYEDMILNKPPDNAYIRKVNYDENPFFANSTLEKQMLSDKERLPPSEFNHKWLGELVTYSEDSLFQRIAPLNQPFHKDNYDKIVVACDPATTNKDYSNEYGIIVAGITPQGLIHIIDDFSDCYTPLEFANNVNTAYNVYNADVVVVETNNGGDMIKSTLLQVNPYLKIKEVRASQDKIQRAMPVASLLSIGSATLLNSLPKLERQMRLMTNKGYLGSRGESPDRLDAMVWAVYELAGLKDRDSIWQVYLPQWFEKKLNNDFIPVSYNNVYIYFNGSHYAYLFFNCYQKQAKYYVDIQKSYIKETFEMYENCLHFINDCPATNTLFIAHADLRSYTATKSIRIDDLITETMVFMRLGRVWLNEGENKDLKLDLMEFSYNNKIRDFTLLRCLCEMIKVELGG